MDKILYYPYINVPRTDWTLRTLLYYVNIGSIVPQEYFFEPDKSYDKFMLELVRNELVTPINPMNVLENPVEVTTLFLEFISKKQNIIRNAQSNFKLSNRSVIHQDKCFTRIHSDKFDENIFYNLIQLGVAEKAYGNWYSVEQKIANYLMKYLATVISAKTNRIPTTDYFFAMPNKNKSNIEQDKRKTILTSLIPFPEDIDLKKLTRFKEKHTDLLKAFRSKIEILVLDEHIKENTPLFEENLKELHLRKEELYKKMDESNFKKFLWGSVCGSISAYQVLAAASTTNDIIFALPGFANAVYSALQIEHAEDVADQSGLKYLALIDKRIRRKNKI